MQGSMLVIRPDDTYMVKHFNAPLLLDDMQEAVGGSIEIVPYFQVCPILPDVDDWTPLDISTGILPTACVALCNEEGKLEGLEPNSSATWLWQISARHFGFGPINDVLHGPVAMIYGDSEFMETI
jgi:hypothetical protein